MIRRVDLLVSLDESFDPAAQRRAAAREVGCHVDEIVDLRLRKRSIDARRNPLRLQLQLDVYVGEAGPCEDLPRPDYRRVHGDRRVVVIGAGPAGLFAALRLIELGIQPIVVDRGKAVQARRRDLAAIQKQGIVDPDSNYCFGEGGAGTYSDGKLYTRSTKRGDVDAVLRTLVAHGAPADILIDAHPHVGSNRLPKVVTALRESIEGAGGEVHFEQRVNGLLRNAAGRIVGVTTSRGSEFVGAGVVLATGHSARDVFSLLLREGVGVESKPFALGVRIEHPQVLIDRVQYHCERRDLRLPAASYRLATTIEERGVFSFCMCPGGFIVPAATEPGEVVVNGMSLSRRDSPYANSGLVTSVELADLQELASGGPLAGIEYQRRIEVAAAQAGGGSQKAPAQRVEDFIAGRVSSSLPASSYVPGLTSAPLHEILPSPIAQRLRQALPYFDRRIRGYVSQDAVVVGVESRTSSPVRVPRDGASLQHPQAEGLFPCGEGAGYAGGIVSAALDGIRVAEAVAGSR